MGFLFDSLYAPTKKDEKIYNYQYETNNSYQTINNANSFTFQPNSNASGIYIDGGKLSNATAQGQQSTPTQQQNDKKTDGSTLWLIAAAAVAAVILIKT